MAWSYALRRAGQIPSVFGSSGAKRMLKSTLTCRRCRRCVPAYSKEMEMDQDNKTNITYRKGHKRSPASPASPAQYARRLSNGASLEGLNGNSRQCGPSLRLRAFAPGAHLFRGPRGETVTSWNRVRGAGLIPSYRTKRPFGPTRGDKTCVTPIT